MFKAHWNSIDSWSSIQFVNYYLGIYYTIFHRIIYNSCKIYKKKCIEEIVIVLYYNCYSK